MNSAENSTEMRVSNNWVDQEDLLAIKARLHPQGTVIFPKVGAALMTEKRRMLSREGTFDNNIMGLIAGTRILPRYLLAVMQGVRLGDVAQQGAVPSVNQGHVAAIPIVLPSLSQQLRIVDVMTAVDSLIEAVAAEVERGSRATRPAIEELLAADDAWPVTSLGDVGTFIRGKRFTKAEYIQDGLGCIHYGHVHTHFGPVATQVVAHLPEEARTRLRLAAPGDVVVAATSEDLEGLGKATVWLGVGDVAVHDDCQIFKHTLDPTFASFVFASPAFQAQKVQYAAGSKVTRISGSDLAKIRIPVPPRAVQERIGHALSEFDAQTARVRCELARLHALRSALLSSLMSRDIDIPESYDAILEGSAR